MYFFVFSTQSLIVKTWLPSTPQHSHCFLYFIFHTHQALFVCLWRIIYLMTASSGAKCTYINYAEYWGWPILNDDKVEGVLTDACSRSEEWSDSTERLSVLGWKEEKCSTQEFQALNNPVAQIFHFFYYGLFFLNCQVTKLSHLKYIYIVMVKCNSLNRIMSRVRSSIQDNLR